MGRFEGELRDALARRESEVERLRERVAALEGLISEVDEFYGDVFSLHHHNAIDAALGREEVDRG